MALAGKYELVREEGQLEHLLATGMSEDRARKMLESKHFEITINGNTVSISRGDSGHVQTLTLGEENTETTPDGKTFKSVAKLDGNKLFLDSQFGEKGSLKREYVLSGNELILTSLSDKPGVSPGKRIYKKL